MATARWVAQTESFAPRCRRANRPRAAAPRLDGSVFVGHRSLVFGKTNESELERRDDTLAFPSEEQRDPGSACSTPANADCRVGRGAGAQARLLLLRKGAVLAHRLARRSLLSWTNTSSPRAPPRCMERDGGSVTAAFDGCRSAVGADCALGDAWSSSVAKACQEAQETPALVRERELAVPR
jgi:hypothetical protein